MKITYIYHSCFLVETQAVILLFDYFKGELPVLDNEKKIYVFASHKHQDHFDLSIFSLAEQYDNVIYILSRDIKMNAHYMERRGISQKARDKIYYVGKNENAIYGDIAVETLTSTDQGVAFIVSLEGETLYHAGDLNWWSWQGESEEESNHAESSFLREMEKIEGRIFDVAFLPLDSRQEDRFHWGFDYFMRATKTKQAIPMHMWGDYSVIPRLKKMNCAKEYADRIEDIVTEGQIIKSQSSQE